MVSARASSAKNSSMAPVLSAKAASAQPRLVHSLRAAGGSIESRELAEVREAKESTGTATDRLWRGVLPARARGSVRHLEGDSAVLLDRPARIPLAFTRDWASLDGSYRYSEAMRKGDPRAMHTPVDEAPGAVARNQAVDKLRAKVGRHNAAAEYFRGRPSRLVRDTYVWRGVSQRGDPMTGYREDASFVPVSTSPATAARFAHKYGADPVVMRVRVPAGTPVLPVGRRSDELLLPPGRMRATGAAGLRVLRVDAGRDTGGGLTHDIEKRWDPPHYVPGGAGYALGMVTPALYEQGALPAPIPRSSLPPRFPLTEAERAETEWIGQYKRLVARNVAAARAKQREKDLASPVLMQARVRRRKGTTAKKGGPSSRRPRPPKKASRVSRK